MEHALVNNSGEILRYEEFTLAPPALAPQKGLRWLPVDETRPAFNPETDSISGAVVTLTPSGVKRVFTVTPKTAAEKNAERAARAQRLETDPALVAIIRQMAADKGIGEAAMLAMVKARIA